jgi:hypothetical protein
MWRTSGGFSVPYFQPSWINRDGVGVVFAVQAAVVAVGVLITILPVYIRENPRRRNESEHEAPNGGDIGDQLRSEDGQEWQRPVLQPSTSIPQPIAVGM